MGKKVNFTAMDQGTQEDYDLIFAQHDPVIENQADQVLGWLEAMHVDSPYRVSRFEHSLQTATRAERDGADDETIVCALLHDIGDLIAPANHSQVAAALLAPYISAKNRWVVEHHGLFQGYYWFQFAGHDRHARETYKDHEYYEDCVRFCANWDQPSFDPDFDTRPLEHFAPLVHELFAKAPADFF